MITFWDKNVNLCNKIRKILQKTLKFFIKVPIEINVYTKKLLALKEGEAHGKRQIQSGRLL